MIRRLSAITLALLLGACSNIVKVEGEQVLQQRLSVRVDQAWNKINLHPGKDQFELWTLEGPGLDQLRLWSAIKPGQSLLPAPRSVPAGETAPRVPTYTSGMRPDQLVALFETAFAVDGSLVTITRSEPATFAGERGVHFEFTVTRKSDDLVLSGAGWAAVRGGELFAATYVAPQLGLWKRLLPRAEAVVRTAQVRG